jgi:hypothetical protein
MNRRETFIGNPAVGCAVESVWRIEGAGRVLAVVGGSGGSGGRDVVADDAKGLPANMAGSRST